MVLTFIAHLLVGDYCHSGEDFPHFLPLPNFSFPGRKVFPLPLFFVGFFLCVCLFFKSLWNLLQYCFYVSVFWP